MEKQREGGWTNRWMDGWMDGEIRCEMGGWTYRDYHYLTFINFLGLLFVDKTEFSRLLKSYRSSQRDNSYAPDNRRKVLHQDYLK
jgi:hypothetical protein